MRKLNWGYSQLLLAECIGQVERTRGTETSKYPQEKKKTLIPQVAASESGQAQTGIRPGVEGAMRGYKTIDSGKVWEVLPKRVIVPYAKLIGPR